MMSTLLTIAVMVVVVMVVVCPPPSSAELIELSYTYNKDAPTSPKLKAFHIDIVQKGLNTYGNWALLHTFCTSEHSGTHIDAPVHYGNQSQWTLDAIPTERLWRRPGVMIDMSRIVRSSGNRNYEVKATELEAWERKHGTIPDGAILLLRTGWGQKTRGRGNYHGLDNHNKLNFPGLSMNAAKWIANHGKRHEHPLGIIGVGIDTLSLDKGTSDSYPVHATLFKHNIYGIENMDNLEKLPVTGFYVTVLSMKIAGGSGAPARIIAETGDTIGMLSTAHPRPAASLALVLALILSVFFMAH